MEEHNLSEVNNEFEKKVYAVADEVLNILKELSNENRQQINSKLIAEKMFWKDSVKNLLENKINSTASNSTESRYLKEVANLVMDKFSGILPGHMTDQLDDLKKSLHKRPPETDSDEWLNSPMDFIKRYIDSISSRNIELEEFIKQTIKCLNQTEVHVSSELSSTEQNIIDEKKFGEDISSSLVDLTEHLNSSDDINSIKNAVMSKIDKINLTIEMKREKDMQRLQDTEKSLDEMGKQMARIMFEADEIRKKSEAMAQEAVRDGLTGLYNRKAYDEKMAETLENIKRYNTKSSMMVCDIDFFKKINDTYGHSVGDLALKKLAALLTERLRANDFVARYGGEEFVVILPHTDIDGAMMVGESIRAYIADSVFSYKDQKIPLTVSIGVSAFRKEDSCESVFERADSSLYLAKRSGRNRVMSETDLKGNYNELDNKANSDKGKQLIHPVGTGARKD